MLEAFDIAEPGQETLLFGGTVFDKMSVWARCLLSAAHAAQQDMEETHRALHAAREEAGSSPTALDRAYLL